MTLQRPAQERSRNILWLRTSSRLLSASLLLVLAGCQSVPSQPEAEHICPDIPVSECPVCEVMECPEAKSVKAVVATPVPVRNEVRSGNAMLPVIGAVEWALVEPANLILEARIDTGADTSSIHAENIRLVERDGKRYVQFSLEDPSTKEAIPVERRLHRRILVKQNTDAPPDRRYVVRMWVTVGTTRLWLDVSLSDRDDFEYDLLLGRNLLVDEFVVDVSKNHTLSKKRLKKVDK